MTRLNLRRCGSLLSAQAMLTGLRQAVAFEIDDAAGGLRRQLAEATDVTRHSLRCALLQAERGEAILLRVQEYLSQQIADCCRFVAVGRNVMLGPDRVLLAVSKTMAKRAARALNNHKPNREGV